MPIGQIEPFNVEGQNWDSYIRRVEQFILLNSISDNLKVATLLTLVGSECYNLICDLCSPADPETKNFEDLVVLVKNHLEPERSEIAERHIFRQRTQQQGESIRVYLHGLKHLAKTCNFGGSLEENLRDQFVSGLYSEEMRSRLFAEKGINYKRAVELATALEAAERHASTACASSGASAGGAGDAAAGDGLHRVGGARARTGAAPAPTTSQRRICARCGKAGHVAGKCRFKNYSCDVCGQKGHLKVMCQGKSEYNSAKEKKGQYFLNDSDSDDNSKFFNLITSNERDGPYYATLVVEKVKCKFEIDTGSKISAISKHYYDKNFKHIPIQSKLLSLRSYTGDVIETLGYIVVTVVCGTKSATLKLFVIENGGPPLMGRTWIKQLKIEIVECHNISDSDSIAKALREEFPEVFAEGLGTFKSPVSLHLKDETPVFVKARPLPLALRPRVETELKRLEQEGVVYKVERSEYGTPIVPVIKSNGSIRICGDYKITINPILKDYHYPLPRIEELFATLGGGEQYTKLDLSNAFQQCLLDKKSQPLTAITTHVGTFIYKRVPFGIKCIPENFQKIMEETLSGLPSTAVFADDICITGKDKRTHLANLRAVLQRLKENGLRINFSKCQFFKDSVTYLGYKIDKNGLHTDTNKIRAIVAAPSPTNVTQLKSFMGLVNFYSKFCSNISDIMKPLYNLLQKNVKWQWNDECERAFCRMKKALSSAPVLAHYDPTLPLVLSVDSSAYGLGAVLAQRYADGSERPVCCASRTLNAAEQNYSQLDKEALAIVFGVRKHHQYLYGREFILRSDHRPLSYIFGANKGIPLTAASRLQRYAVQLSAYNFKIEFIKSEQNCHADALSRLPLDSTQSRTKGKDGDDSYLNFVQENFPISFKDIKIETAKDPLLTKIYGYVMFGWPKICNIESEKAYFIRKESICIDQGCLIWGYRVIIPKSLRLLILKEIHDGHPGIVKMKQIARNYVWWETLESDIERTVQECVACRSQRSAPAPAPLHSWPWPEEPWARLNLDFLGPFNNKYYLVIVDAHSKWIEVEHVSCTSAVVVIDSLRKLFARFGLPKRIVSDNGPPFSSAEFKKYLDINGIRHTLVAPYHPSSNGAAENAVKLVKRALKKAQVENENVNTALSRFLFSYRNTEHSTTGREPAMLMFGRRLRGRLDLLRPDTRDLVRQRQEVSERRRESTLRVTEPHDSVLLRDYTKGRAKWTEGTVVRRESPVSYTVKSRDGRVHKRHIDQILTPKNRKSRFSLSNVHEEACEKVDAEPVVAPNTDQQEPLAEEWELANESPPSRSPSVRHDDPLTTPRNRRKAALRCLDKLKKL